MNSDLVNIIFAVIGGFLGWYLHAAKAKIVPAWLSKLLEEEEQKKKEQEELQRAREFLEKASSVVQKQSVAPGGITQPTQPSPQNPAAPTNSSAPHNPSNAPNALPVSPGS